MNLKETKNIFIRVAVVVLVVSAYYFGTTSSNSDEPQESIQSTSTSVVVQEQVPVKQAAPQQVSQKNQTSYRSRFIASCGYRGVYSGAIYCTCIYDNLSNVYSDAQISQVVFGSPDPELSNAVAICNARLQQ